MNEDYFLEIESHFAERRGTPFVLSAKDWALMKEWSEAAIPLPVVIEAIDSVFQKNEGKKAINSLSYCKHAVKELWKERRELQVGANEETPEADPTALLDALALDVEQSSAPGAVDVAAQIRELARERSVPRIEERLIELEQELISRALTSADVAAIRAEVARALGDTSKLDAKTRARTEEANLRRVVRERFALPRLTLFR